MAKRDNYPTIRKTARNWEYETYADFKEALAVEAQNSTVNARRNQRLDPTFNVKRVPANRDFVETMFDRAFALIDTIGEATSVNKQLLTAAQQLGGIVKELQRGGYLTEDQFTQLQTFKQYITMDGITPGSEFAQLVSNYLSIACEDFLNKDENALAIFDEAVGAMRLPKGVRHAPERVKQSAVQVHEGLVNITMSPGTKSNAKVRVQTPPSTALGPKNAISKLSLGDLTQGLPQKLFFGVLRNFWYSKTVDMDIKRYLAERYLREFRQVDAPFAIADRAGDIIRFTSPQILGFTGQGAKGASQKQIDKTNVSSARDVAIRTWIQQKNIPAAQSIPGQFKYAYVGM